MMLYLYKNDIGSRPLYELELTDATAIAKKSESKLCPKAERTMSK